MPSPEPMGAPSGITAAAPASSMASRMFSKDAYFPVPTIRRDLNSLPPSHSDVSYISPLLCSAAAHRADDLHPVAVAKHRPGVLVLRRHLAVHRHRGVLP